uniref:Uncharacterized protein n=1 Tax=Solanum tuberosum TaxID=4113 RepID=M1CNF5_SOLTU
MKQRCRTWILPHISAYCDNIEKLTRPLTTALGITEKDSSELQFWCPYLKCATTSMV